MNGFLFEIQWKYIITNKYNNSVFGWMSYQPKRERETFATMCY